MGKTVKPALMEHTETQDLYIWIIVFFNKAHKSARYDKIYVKFEPRYVILRQHFSY